MCNLCAKFLGGDCKTSRHCNSNSESLYLYGAKYWGFVDMFLSKDYMPKRAVVFTSSLFTTFNFFEDVIVSSLFARTLYVLSLLAMRHVKMREIVESSLPNKQSYRMVHRGFWCIEYSKHATASYVDKQQSRHKYCISLDWSRCFGKCVSLANKPPKQKWE